MRIVNFYRNSLVLRVVTCLLFIVITLSYCVVTHTATLACLGIFYVIHLYTTLFMCITYEDNRMSHEERTIIGPAKMILASWMIFNPVSDDGYLNFAWVSLAALYVLSGAANIYVVFTDTADVPSPDPAIEYARQQDKARKKQERAEQSLMAELNSYLSDADPSRK